MKIKVTTEFTDRYTGELHRVGEEMEVSVQRVNEILSVGAFITIVEEAPVQDIAPESKNDEQEQEQEQEQEAPAEKAAGKRTRKTKTDTE